MPNALSMAKAMSRKSRLSMPRSLIAWLSGVILSRGMSQVSEMIPATVSNVGDVIKISLGDGAAITSAARPSQGAGRLAAGGEPVRRLPLPPASRGLRPVTRHEHVAVPAAGDVLARR